MKKEAYGRIVFGASAVLLGVIALMWYDADTWQTMARIWKLPLGMAIGGCLMAAQIAGGLGIQHPKTAHLASTVLAIVYLLFSFACVPGIVHSPGVYAAYGSFFEQFAALSGAIALYAATETNASRAKTFGRAARLGMGASATSFTLSQIIYFGVTADLVPKWIPPNHSFWTTLTTIAFGLAAISLLINRKTRLAAQLLTLMLAMFGILVWIPRLIAHPEAHFNWSECALTFLITGAVWVVSELPSEIR
jgi:hypothetical protein